MVRTFPRNAAVVDYGPRSHVKWATRERILWPTWAYRVVAPQVRPRRLNIFEQTVLRLGQAGVFRSGDIAELMSLHPDLIDLIHADLRMRSYLDENGVPTEQGLSVLHEDEIREEDLVTGFVFQDTVGGELMPRFVEQLSRAEVEYGANGFPIVMGGTDGKPRRLSPYVVSPGKARAAAAPRPELVVEAIARSAASVKKWRSGRNRRDSNNEQDDTYEQNDLDDFLLSRATVDRVSFIDEEPLPVYLLTFLYVPESSEREMDWYACDPFGMGHDPRLRNQINSRLTSDTGLKNKIIQLLSKSTRLNLQDHFNFLNGIAELAPLQVQQRIPGIESRHPAFGQLVQFEAAFQEISHLGSSCPMWKIESFLREATKVLEAVFAHIEHGYAIEGVWSKVDVGSGARRSSHPGGKRAVDRKWLRVRIEAAFKSVGFPESVPKRLGSVSPQSLSAAVRYRDPSKLAAFIAATALVAEDNLKHPLAVAAVSAPELLTRISNIIDAGAPAGHANADPSSLGQAKAVMDDTYFVIAKLLGYSVDPFGEPAPCAEGVA